MHLGSPIDVDQILADADSPRAAGPLLTAALQQRIQTLLDDIGPGRPLDEKAGSVLINVHDRWPECASMPSACDLADEKEGESS
jgi:hypothetical protein